MKNNGFKNEEALKNALNHKHFNELSKNLQNIIKSSFSNHNGIIKIKSQAGHNKSDLKIIIGNESHTYSIKMGKGNSVHQEPLEDFILFLEKEYQLPSSTKEALQRFIWADGTSDGSGEIKNRISSKKFKKKNPQLVKEIQNFFNQHKRTLLERFLINGVHSNSSAEFIYYGTIKRGVICKSKEVVHWVASHHSRGTLNIGKLTFQAWNRNLKGKQKAEKKRGVIQLKWGGLQKDIRKIVNVQQGKEEEINFNKLLNQKEQLHFWETLKISPKNHYAIHLKYQHYGKLNHKKVWAKADVFIAKGEVPTSYLEHKQYFLDEDDVKKFQLIPIDHSGISIKQPHSKHYSIAKISPNAFKQLFGSNILAVGTSIYYRKKKKLKFNKHILEAWNISEKEFFNYYSVAIQKPITSVTNPNCQPCLKKIKRYAKKAIAKRINENHKISAFIFKGEGNFEEPFTAPWLYAHGKLKKNTMTPFSITTGSGRSHGHFSIVIKPK